MVDGESYEGPNDHVEGRKELRTTNLRVAKYTCSCL